MARTPAPPISLAPDDAPNVLPEGYVLIRRDAIEAIRALAEEKGFLDDLKALDLVVHEGERRWVTLMLANRHEKKKAPKKRPSVASTIPSWGPR